MTLITEKKPKPQPNPKTMKRGEGKKSIKEVGVEEYQTLQ